MDDNDNDFWKSFLFFCKNKITCSNNKWMATKKKMIIRGFFVFDNFLGQICLKLSSPALKPKIDLKNSNLNQKIKNWHVLHTRTIITTLIFRQMHVIFYSKSVKKHIPLSKTNPKKERKGKRMGQILINFTWLAFIIIIIIIIIIVVIIENSSPALLCFFFVFLITHPAITIGKNFFPVKSHHSGPFFFFNSQTLLRFFLLKKKFPQ